VQVGNLGFHLNRVEKSNETNAKVVDKYRGNKMLEGYKIQYSFNINGSYVTSECRVKKSFWDKVQVGNTVSILYNKKKPRTTSLNDSSSLGLTQSIITTSIMLIMFLLLCYVVYTIYNKYK
jgi:hypothetical protein